MSGKEETADIQEVKRPDGLGGRPAAGEDPVKREQILDSAQRLFSELGFRAVSMERIAEQAGLAKATLYAYFSDKEQVFRAVAERLAQRMVRAVHGELASKGTLTQRVIRALQAKDHLIFELVRASPHAQELFAAKNSLVRERFQQADREIVAAIAALIAQRKRRAQADAIEPARLAQILFDAATGLANASKSAAGFSVDLEILVRALLNASARSS